MSDKKRLPFGDAVLANLTVFDPEKRLSVTPVAITQLAWRFPNVVPSEDIDKLIDDFLEYQHMNFDAKLLDKLETPIDVFWHKVSCQLRGIVKRFCFLPKVMKSSLSLLHNNAAAE